MSNINLIVNEDPSQNVGLIFEAGDPECQTPVVIAFEIILGSGIVALGMWLAYMQGVGAIGLAAVGGGGVLGIIFLVAATYCIRKKSPSTANTKKEEIPNQEVDKIDFIKDPRISKAPTPQPTLDIQMVDSVIEDTDPINQGPIIGKIAICEPLNAGALGTDVAALFNATRKVERTDHNEWKDFPNEMLIEFQVFDIEKKKSRLPNNYRLYLPLCLFIHNDYTNWKKEGETVQFIYDGETYELTLSQQRSKPKTNFEDLIPLCEQKYQSQGGYSILPHHTNEDGNPTIGDCNSYISPIELSRRQNGKSKVAEISTKILQEFPDQPRLHDLNGFEIPSHTLCDKQLDLEINGVDEVDYFYSERSCVIYAPKGLFGQNRKALSNNRSSGYIFRIEFNEDLTLEKIKNAKKEFKGSILEIKFLDS